MTASHAAAHAESDLSATFMLAVAGRNTRDVGVARLDRSSTAREAVPTAIIRRVLQARQHPLAPEEQVVNYAMRQAIGGVGQAGSVGDNNDDNTATVTGDGFAVAAVGTINIDGLTAIAGAGQTVTAP